MSDRRYRDSDLELVAAASRSRRRRRAGKGRRPRRVAAFTGFLVVLVAVVSAAVIAAAVAPRVIASRCDLRSLKQLTIGTNSFVTASNGSLLGTIPAKRNRQQLTLAQISPWLPRATVAIEDRRFWQHGALDYAGIVRAVLADLQSGRAAQGASTLTQQLARNLYIGRPSQTLSRKIKEACLGDSTREEAAEALDPG